MELSSIPGCITRLFVICDLAALSAFAAWVHAQDPKRFDRGDPAKGIRELCLPHLNPARSTMTALDRRGADAVLPERVERRSATYYGAEYCVVEGAGHDLMLERSYIETARMIHDWLAERVE